MAQEALALGMLDRNDVLVRACRASSSSGCELDLSWLAAPLTSPTETVRSVAEPNTPFS